VKHLSKTGACFDYFLNYTNSYLQGNAEFDPIGFSDYYDVKFLREAELKHGRVSMLAVVGWLTTVSLLNINNQNQWRHATNGNHSLVI
jgi:hypothetical protein